MKLPVWSGTPSARSGPALISRKDFPQPFLRVKRAGCLRLRLVSRLLFWLSGGLCRFGGRDRRAAPATRLSS